MYSFIYKLYLVYYNLKYKKIKWIHHFILTCIRDKNLFK